MLIAPDGKHARAATRVEGPAGPFISVARYAAPTWPASLPCHGLAAVAAAGIEAGGEAGRAPAGPPVPAAAVREHPYPHFPVQLLHDVIAQPGERHPALRAAVPAAGKIPDHLDPGQMRVIPAPATEHSKHARKPEITHHTRRVAQRPSPRSARPPPHDFRLLTGTQPKRHSADQCKHESVIRSVKRTTDLAGTLSTPVPHSMMLINTLVGE